MEQSRAEMFRIWLKLVFYSIGGLVFLLVMLLFGVMIG